MPCCKNDKNENGLFFFIKKCHATNHKNANVELLKMPCSIKMKGYMVSIKCQAIYDKTCHDLINKNVMI